MTTTSRPAMPWLIILAGSLIAVMTFGPRSAMGFRVTLAAAPRLARRSSETRHTQPPRAARAHVTRPPAPTTSAPAANTACSAAGSIR